MSVLNVFVYAKHEFPCGAAQHKKAVILLICVCLRETERCCIGCVCVSLCRAMFLYIRSESLQQEVCILYIPVYLLWVCSFLSNQQACRSVFPCYFYLATVCFWLSWSTLECLKQQRLPSSGEMESSAVIITGIKMNLSEGNKQ